VHFGGVKEMRKVSIRTVEGNIGLARSVANGTTKFPFLGYCADQMERMLEEIKEARKAQEYIAQLEKGLESSIAMNKAQAERFAELERKHKEEFDYAEKLLKERNK
jgi:hypothetical protein